MNNITLFDNFLKNYLNIFSNSNNLFSLEQKIINVSDKFTLDLIAFTLQSIDLNFKNSKERKEKYYVKETYTRSFLTSVGYITIPLTRYQDKITKKSFNYIRELLNILPYQRTTLFAEYIITKYAVENNMSQAARYSIRNTEVSRSYVSKLFSKLDGSIYESYPKVKRIVPILYLETDEIHANLQNKFKNKYDKPKNCICPCIVVHEGHIDSSKKRKKLKNPHYFASSDLSYKDVYELAYNYIDSHYDTSSTIIFISGDGGKGIKSFEYSFPNAIFVADKFHYKKALKYIFKEEKDILKKADDYLRNDMLEEFKYLVKLQIEKFPYQKDKMETLLEYFLNNLDGIKNQRNELYKCPCSMEGTISNKFARYITSSPYAFSKRGLKNKLKLLVLKANKHELTFDDYILLKYANNEDDKIIDNINKLTDIKVKIKIKDHSSFTPISSSIPYFKDININNYINNLINARRGIKFQ